MVNQQLLDYIKQQLQEGKNKEQIKSLLVAKGWQGEDIDEAFSFIENLVSQSQSVSAPRQTISSLPGARAIFGQALAIYKQRLGTFLGIMAIPMLIMIVLFAILVSSGLLAILFSPKFPAVAIGFLLLTLFFLIILIIFSIISACGQTALLYAIKDNQERIGVIESYRRGWHKILSYWWISLLRWFITLGGFLLLIVPGIIFAIWFSLAPFILIAEDLRGMNALLKSREYVRGNWFGVFWRFFFIGAISFIIYLVPSVIASVLKIPLVENISRLIIALFWAPLVTTYSFLVYSNLKALKGEIAFAPTKGKKTAFILVGLLGVLFIPAILFFSQQFLRHRL